MSRQKIRLILLIAISASLGGVAYKVAESIKKPLKLLDYVPEAALQIKDFHRAKVEDGRKVWELFGEEARYLKEEKEAVIKKPRIVFYDKKGGTIEATGEEGHLFFADKGNHQEMEKIQLKGGIQVSYRGFVLRTDEALYLKDTNQVVSPGKVTLAGDGLELEGTGMEIALDNERIRLLKKVRTKLQPERLKKRG